MSETLRRIRTHMTRQDELGIKKEWFHSSSGDLLLRRDKDEGGEIVGFEMAFDYGTGPNQIYARWEKNRVVRTGIVDTGCRPGDQKRTPIVHGHTNLSRDILEAMTSYISDRRRKIPDDIRDFVLQKLARPATSV